MEMVMEIRVSMAKLTGDVERLQADSEEQGVKLGKVYDDVRTAKVTLRVVGVILGLIGAGVLWFLNEALQLLRPLTQNAIQ